MVELVQIPATISQLFAEEPESSVIDLDRGCAIGDNGVQDIPSILRACADAGGYVGDSEKVIANGM